MATPLRLVHRTVRFLLIVPLLAALPAAGQIGSERAATTRLADGDEHVLEPAELVSVGGELFNARWTDQEGGGRPMTKGTGDPLADPSRPLVFPRNFNRISGPDSNGCISCHGVPIAGGGGDFANSLLLLSQRFDFATFDADDPVPTAGSVDELGNFVDMLTVGNLRVPPGLHGSGYLEMLARQMSAELRAVKESLLPGESAPLVANGVDFGVLSRNADGSWDTSAVEGLPAPALQSPDPDLVIRPFHQAGAVISIREFANNAMNHHHGIQTTERFGPGDADGDGFTAELTRAEVTALVLHIATLPTPGRVIPRDPEVEQAVLRGEHLFVDLGCARCHVPALPLEGAAQAFAEPNPFNPEGNLRPGDAAPVAVGLDDPSLPSPRLHSEGDVTWVPAYTDFKLHDITSGPDDPHRDGVNMHFEPGSVEFLAGNSRFLTKRLWGAANEPPFLHHGKVTTLRTAILAHAGEALPERQAFEGSSAADRDALIEFLKTLQVLPEGTPSRFVDENYQPRTWPPPGEETPLFERSRPGRVTRVP